MPSLSFSRWCSSINFFTRLLSLVATFLRFKISSNGPCYSQITNNKAKCITARVPGSDNTTPFSTSLALLPLDLLDESILLDGVLDLDGVSKENIGVLPPPDILSRLNACGSSREHNHVRSSDTIDTWQAHSDTRPSSIYGNKLLI